MYVVKPPYWAHWNKHPGWLSKWEFPWELMPASATTGTALYWEWQPLVNLTNIIVWLVTIQPSEPLAPTNSSVAVKRYWGADPVIIWLSSSFRLPYLHIRQIWCHFRHHILRHLGHQQYHHHTGKPKESEVNFQTFKLRFVWSLYD
jgi:hypothetical protein